jgi:hypothetical protein
LHPSAALGKVEALLETLDAGDDVAREARGLMEGPMAKDLDRLRVRGEDCVRALKDLGEGEEGEWEHVMHRFGIDTYTSEEGDLFRVKLEG